MKVFGPEFDDALDGDRIRKQRDHVRDWMLEHGCIPQSPAKDVSRGAENKEPTAKAQSVPERIVFGS